MPANDWQVTPASQNTSAGVDTPDYSVELLISVYPTGAPADSPFTLDDGGGGGTFTPPSVIIHAGQQSVTFKYRNSAGGTYPLTVSQADGYTPGSLSVTAVVGAPTPTAPQMDYRGAPPWASPPTVGRAFAGGLGFFTPPNLPAPPGIQVVFATPAPASSGQAARGYNGVVQSDPPPAIVNNLAFLRFSMCRDNRGARWTEEYEVGQKADIDSCGGCWLGNAFGCLYSQGGALYWVRSDNPEKWMGAPQPVTMTTGHIYGMAQTRWGVLCAIVGTNVILSRDRGAKWSAPVAVPIADPSVKPVTIVTTADEQAFVIVQPNGDNSAPKHWVSWDGGETWL